MSQCSYVGFYFPEVDSVVLLKEDSEIYSDIYVPYHMVQIMVCTYNMVKEGLLAFFGALSPFPPLSPAQGNTLGPRKYFAVLSYVCSCSMGDR